MTRPKTVSLSGFFLISAAWHVLFILLFSTIFTIGSGPSSEKAGINVVYVADSDMRTMNRLSSGLWNRTARIVPDKKAIRRIAAEESDLFVAPEKEVTIKETTHDFFEKKEPGLGYTGRTDMALRLKKKAPETAAAEESAVRLSPNLRQRKIRWMPEKPDCPLWAEKAGIELNIQMRIVIGPNGRVRRTRLLKSSGDPDLDIRVRKFVNGFIFENKPGQDTADTGTINIFFRLLK